MGHQARSTGGKPSFHGEDRDFGFEQGEFEKLVAHLCGV